MGDSKITNASKFQIEQFKKKYCRGDKRRRTIKDNFAVVVESCEELLPGHTVKSYATGNRDINKIFVVFMVTDVVNNVVYHPIFSDPVGRALAKEWGLKMPRKMTVFTEDKKGGGNGVGGGDGGVIQRQTSNQAMLLLIQFARSMMILHVDEPAPIHDPFKSIYNKLEANPRKEVDCSDVKSVNTAITSFLRNSINMNHENFAGLQEYIGYLQKAYSELRLRKFDFDVLRDKMRAEHPDVKIVF